MKELEAQQRIEKSFKDEVNKLQAQKDQGEVAVKEQLVILTKLSKELDKQANVTAVNSDLRPEQQKELKQTS